MPTQKAKQGHTPTYTDGRQLNCPCGTDPKNGYWVWCPLHAAAPAMYKKLQEYVKLMPDKEAIEILALARLP